VLIKEFCQATGLPRDTVRFYVKRGLLTPDVGSRASNRYQVFDQAQVERARLIRTAQRLGFSLGEIARLAQKYEGRDVPRAAKAELLRSRLAALDEQARLLRLMRSYLAAKLRWVEEGEVGAPPAFPAPPSRARASAKLAAE
jgi:DNA-binding transcriptional MerR regulator